MPPDAAAGTRLKEHFDGQALAQHGRLWDALWREGYTPWDRGGPSAALRDLVVADRPDLFAGRRGAALVPGCGRGHDVRLLAALGGWDVVVGLESSAAAVEEAEAAQRAWEEEQQQQGQQQQQQQQQQGGEQEERPGPRVRYVLGDFFSDGFLRETATARFDLIYDYTFLCALPPSARPRWAKRMADLLAWDGRLVCLEFPANKSPSAGGPPWALPENVYLAHLARPGEKIPYDEDLQTVIESQMGPPTPTGLTRLARIKPRRTHPSGYDSDGNVDDWISVWGHSDRAPASSSSSGGETRAAAA